MAKFTVRVELKGLLHDHADYARLDALMLEEGFSRVLLADRGKSYQLPPGEYDIEAEHSKEMVCVMARAAAEKLGHKFSVLVTKAASRVWYGLETV